MRSRSRNPTSMVMKISEPIPKELEKEKSSDEGEGVTREEVAMKEEATEVIARRAVRPPQEALEARVLAHLIVVLRYQ